MINSISTAIPLSAYMDWRGNGGVQTAERGAAAGEASGRGGQDYVTLSNRAKAAGTYAYKDASVTASDMQTLLKAVDRIKVTAGGGVPKGI